MRNWSKQSFRCNRFDTVPLATLSLIMRRTCSGSLATNSLQNLEVPRTCVSRVTCGPEIYYLYYRLSFSAPSTAGSKTIMFLIFRYPYTFVDVIFFHSYLFINLLFIKFLNTPLLIQYDSLMFSVFRSGIILYI